ncbi:MAG: rhomboid family intramembrane serine protease [Sphaerobacter sp.]|nr:rhomboid family intramembrane serine protease [Sphaerobacter sp.]
MIPYADEPQPSARRVPVVTVAIIALCIAVFAYEVSLGPEAAQAFVVRWGFTPADFWAGRNLETLVTSQFLHGGLLHIAGNLLFLWVFGDNVEDQLGHGTYALFYLASGVAANVVFAVAFPQAGDPLVGASGAIAGVLAGYLLLFPRAMVRTLLAFGPFVTVGRVAAVLLIGLWFILQLIQGAISVLPTASATDVAFLAHVGGFVFGLIATGTIREVRDQELCDWRGRRWWSRSFRNWVLLALAVTVLLAGSQVLLSGGASAAGALARVTVGAGVVALALLDGVARLLGRRGLLGSSPQTNRLIAAVQILAALSLAGSLFLTAG